MNLITVRRSEIHVGDRHHIPGFSSAFEIADLISFAGFVTVLVAVRHRQSPATAAPSIEVEVAA